MKTTVVISDIQHPYHDPVALKKVLQVVSDLQPDAVVQIGDGIDMPQPSQWSRGGPGEHAGTLNEHIRGYREDFLSPLRQAAPKAAITWIEGNHDSRLNDYLRKYGPAAAGLEAIDFREPKMFDLDRLNIKYVKGPVRIATNTYAIHGHESGGYSASASAWDNKFAKRYGSDKSFVFGHTHQGFLITRAYGYGGKVTPRFTMNVGSLMDPVQATYVKDGAVSWQPSFALLRDDGKRVWPELVTMVDRLFYVGGRRY